MYKRRDQNNVEIWTRNVEGRVWGCPDISFGGSEEETGPVGCGVLKRRRWWEVRSKHWGLLI